MCLFGITPEGNSQGNILLLPCRAHLRNNRREEFTKKRYSLLLSCVLWHNTRVEVTRKGYSLSSSGYLGNNIWVEVTRKHTLLPSNTRLGNNTWVLVRVNTLLCCHLVCVLRITPQWRSAGNAILCCYLVHFRNNNGVEVTKKIFTLLSSSVHLRKNTWVHVTRKSNLSCHIVCILGITCEGSHQEMDFSPPM